MLPTRDDTATVVPPSLRCIESSLKPACMPRKHVVAFAPCQTIVPISNVSLTAFSTHRKKPQDSQLPGAVSVRGTEGGANDTVIGAVN